MNQRQEIGECHLSGDYEEEASLLGDTKPIRDSDNREAEIVECELVLDVREDSVSEFEILKVGKSKPQSAPQDNETNAETDSLT